MNLLNLLLDQEKKRDIQNYRNLLRQFSFYNMNIYYDKKKIMIDNNKIFTIVNYKKKYDNCIFFITRETLGEMRLSECSRRLNKFREFTNLNIVYLIQTDWLLLNYLYDNDEIEYFNIFLSFHHNDHLLENGFLIDSEKYATKIKDAYETQDKKVKDDKDLQNKINGFNEMKKKFEDFLRQNPFSWKELVENIEHPFRQLSFNFDIFLKQIENDSNKDKIVEKCTNNIYQYKVINAMNILYNMLQMINLFDGKPRQKDLREFKSKRGNYFDSYVSSIGLYEKEGFAFDYIVSDDKLVLAFKGLFIELRSKCIPLSFEEFKKLI